MTSFSSASLGSVEPPINIFKEILNQFNKRDKCKAAILSFFEARTYYQEWSRATFEDLARALGYHRDTISRHIKELVQDKFLIAKSSNLFPKDTAKTYKVDSELFMKYFESKPVTERVLEQCGKTGTEAPETQRINTNNPATYKNDLKEVKSISQKPQREIPQASLNTQNPSVQGVPNEQEAQNKTLHENNHKNNISAASSDIPKKRITSNTENNSQESDRTQKYSWEIEVDVPYPAFLEWWANTHYKPQGGRFETGARSFAYSEFYKKPKKTTAVMYPDFLEYINTTVQSCNQVQMSGQQAILPTCFIAKPEATEENTQALMNNITTLVERGAAVLMPTKSTTPTSQALPFAEVQGAAVIKALPALEEVDIEAELRRQRELCNQPEKEVELFNEWLNSNSFALKQEAQKLAMVKKYGIERDGNGDIVKVFINQNALPKAANSMPSNALNNIDWDSISAQCQELEKDAWESQ